MLTSDTLLRRLRTTRLVTRGATLLKRFWPYAVAALLPGGSLIAIGLWMYERHRSGKRLLR